MPSIISSLVTPSIEEQVDCNDCISISEKENSNITCHATLSINSDIDKVIQSDELVLVEDKKEPHISKSIISTQKSGTLKRGHRLQTRRENINMARSDILSSSTTSLSSLFPTASSTDDSLIIDPQVQQGSDKSSKNVLPLLTLYAGEDAPLPGAGRGTYKFSSNSSELFEPKEATNTSSIQSVESSTLESRPSDSLEEQQTKTICTSIIIDRHASIPLADRLASKNSSLKKSAVIELTEACKRFVTLPMTEAPTIEQNSVLFSSSPASVGTLLSSIISDGNALVSEAGVALVAAMCIFFTPGSLLPPAQSPRANVLGLLKGNGKDLIQKITSKAFSASRSLLIDTAVNAVSSLMAYEGVESGLLEMMDGLRCMPKPKFIKCCSRVLVSLCEASLLKPSTLQKGCLGPGVRLDGATFTAQLPTLLLSADKLIFSAGLELTKAFLVIFPRDIEKMCLDYGKKAGGFSQELVSSILSTQGHSSSQASESSNESSTTIAGSTAAKPAVVVPLWDRLDAAYALSSSADTVDVSKAVEAVRLEATFTGGKNGAPKWGDKVKAINSLINAIEGTAFSKSDEVNNSPSEDVLGHIRIAGDSHTFSSEVATLRKGIKDSNANVAARSMQALSSFASRMRSSFSLSAKQSLGDVVSRLKEKSRATVVASSTCIKAFVRWDCVAIEDVIAELLPSEGGFGSSQIPSESESWRKASPELKTNLCIVVHGTLGTPVTSPPLLFSSSGPNFSRIRCLARFGEASSLDANAEVRAQGEKLIAAISRRIALTSKNGESESALTSNADLAKVLNSLPVAARERVVALAKVVDLEPVPSETPSTSSTIAVTIPLSNSARPQGPVSVPVVVASKKGVKSTTGAQQSSVSTRHVAAPSSSSSSSSNSGGAADAWYESTIAEEQGSSSMSGDEALETLLAIPLPLFDEVQSRSLGSLQWKDKRDAISAFGVAVCSLPSNVAGAYADRAILVLAHKTSGFKGLNNPNVLVSCASTIEAIARICTESSNILRRTARTVLDGLLPYTKERKGSEEICSMAFALARVVGPNLVASRLYSLSAEEKATPGVRAAANERIGALICGYGVGRLAAGPALRHLAGPFGVQCSSLPVKNAAIRALCQLHRQLGPPLLDSLKAAKNKFNLGDMLVKTIVSEFEKAWSPDMPYSSEDMGGGAYEVSRARALVEKTFPTLLETFPPIVTLHGESPRSGSSLTSEIGIGSFASSISNSASALLGEVAVGKNTSSNSYTNLAPQALVDVLSLLPRSILNDLEFESAKAEDVKKPKGGKSEDMKPWQVRMKAVETVTATLSQASAASFGAPCVSSTESVLFLARSLKKTLSDSQANTRPKACNAVSELAKAVGSLGMLRCGALKLLVPCLLDQLGDKKAGLREAVLVALDALVAEQPSQSQQIQLGATAVFSPSFCAIVEAAMKGSAMATNVGGARDDVLCWIARHSAAISSSPTANQLFQQLASKAVDALGDRSPAARAAASDLVAHVVRIAGIDSVKSALDMLKPAQRLAVEGSLESAVASGKALLAQANASKTSGENATSIVQPISVDFTDSVTSLSSHTQAGKTLVKKVSGQAKLGTTSTLVSSTSVASSDSYALFRGPAAAKESRMSKSTAESSAVRFNLRLGSEGGSSDAALQQRQLLRLTQNDWISAKCASTSLMTNLFADGDSASEKHIEAMKWITNQLMLDCTDISTSATSPTLDFVRGNSDLLFKYIAAQLWEPRGKPSLLLVTQTLLDRILSLFSQRGWSLVWLEGEVLLPALCERSGNLGGSASSEEKVSGLIVNTILLLRTCLEYAPRGSTGVDSPLAHIMERHIYNRILDTKAKQSMRVSLCCVAARLMRTVSYSGATHTVTLRRSTVVQLVRLCERDGMHPRDSPLQNVEVRTAIGELLAELFAQLGGGSDSSISAWTSFWRLATIDTKAATTMGLPVGVTLEVEARLRNDIEKKWMPAWISKRNRDVENESRFVSSSVISLTRASGALTTTTTTMLPCDDEIAAALNEPSLPIVKASSIDALPLSPQHLTAGIRRSSIEKALMAAVEDEANAAAVAAALSAGEKAVAAVVPQLPRSGVVWRSNAASIGSLQQLPSSPARPIQRSTNGQSKIPSPAPSALKRLRTATSTSDVPIPTFGGTDVLLLSAGPVVQFPTIPAGVLPSCPVDVCSGLVNLRSACKRIGDVLGMLSNHGQSIHQQQQHSSSAAFSSALAPAMGDAAASLEALETSIRGACKTNCGEIPNSVAKALCENSAVVVDSLTLAWRILPSSPTVMGAGASSPRSKGPHVSAAIRAMATLPSLSTLLLAQVPGFAKSIPDSSSHFLLSAIEFAHARQAHAHARSVHEGVGRALMAAVYHLKRATVAAWFLYAMKSTAAWSPESPVDPAPLPFNSRRTRNLRSLMRRLCSYEFRLDREVAPRRDKWVSSHLGAVTNETDTPQGDLVLLVKAFADVFDDKVISPRAVAIVFASDSSLLQVGPNGEIPKALSSRSILGCECDGDICASIIGAITSARDLFAGVVGQTGLSLSPALSAIGLPASSASPEGHSVLRKLYHALLSAMATQQGVKHLSEVKAWEFDMQSAEEALVRANLSSINLNSTTSSIASLDAAAVSIVPSTPGFNRTGSVLGATTSSSSSITSPTSAFSMELVGSVTSAVAASAVLPFNDAAETVSRLKSRSKHGTTSLSSHLTTTTTTTTSTKEPRPFNMFSSPTPNTLPGMGYDDMALAAATPMPSLKTRMVENLSNTSFVTESKLLKPASNASVGATGPITTPAALRKAPAAIIVPLGIAIAAQNNVVNSQILPILPRQLDLVTEEIEIPLTSVSAVVTTISSSAVPPIAPIPINPIQSSTLPLVEDCRAAAALLHPSLVNELAAALGPCLVAANTLSSSTTAPSPPPPWKTHAVPLIAALVNRATLQSSQFGLSFPFKGTGRDAVMSDPIAAALYVSVCDAGVSLTSQKVLFSNLNLFALKNGGGGTGPDSIALGKTPLFMFAKFVTQLSTTTQTGSSVTTIKPVLGSSSSSMNVPIEIQTKIRAPV